jgi:hypothetical protein
MSICNHYNDLLHDMLIIKMHEKFEWKQSHNIANFCSLST